MSDFLSHSAFVESTTLSPEEIARRNREIHEFVLAESQYLDRPNFTQIHPDDLQRLFDAYDERYFEGRCRSLLGQSELRFRISSRMTKSGAKTTRVRRARSQAFEIAVSSTLMFQTFHELDRPIIVTGLECRNRLEALQCLFEHELMHLVELLLWERSSCSAGRFQSMAARFFGHADHRHQLVTPSELAVAKFGIRPGGRVRFRMDGEEYVGFVNRITKRATVLVEDDRGQPYSNGKRYAKFYVPLGMLEPLD